MYPEAAAAEAEIRSRTIRPGAGDLSPEAACEWLRRISDADAERVCELSEKAHAGPLTVTEQRNLDNYPNVARTLEFL